MYLNIERKPKELTAVVEENGARYTYGEIELFVKEFEAWIPSRSLIFLFCQNSMGAIAGHIACIENGIVPLMISRRMDRELQIRLIETYQPAYFWMPEDMRNFDLDGKTVAKKYGYALYQTGYDSPVMNEDLSMLLTTSGSTGSPKLVRHSYQNLSANAEHVAEFFGFTSDDRSWIDLQLHYTMGLNVACSSLFAGATLLMTTRTMMEKEYWEMFSREKPTNLTGVPYSYELLKKLRFFKKDWPDLRILAEGGGRLTDEMFQETAAWAKEHGKQFFATFGTSETTARLAYLNPDQALTHIGSMGKAIPGGTLFLIDDEGNRLSDGEATGELVYQGENVTLGYGNILHCR